jgi:hypothetical protein
LAQGVALCILLDVIKPADGEPIAPWLAAARSVAALAPFVLLGGLGAMKARSLAIWTIAAVLGLAAIAAYAAATGGVRDFGPPLWPLFTGGAAVTLFIVHHLVVAADQEGRWRASYRLYFDLGWTNGVRLALSAAFVAALWALLALGASLFALIGIRQIWDLIREPWFAAPATAVAFAAAVHLTDVRASLVRGVRTVALALLSWLLPLMTVIAGGFLATLPFTGLDVLWNTATAAGLLLSAAAALIILLNAAYQDGPREDLPKALQWSGRVAAALLAPLAILAAYAVALRIGQYGLTPERIGAVACVLVALAFAAGYLAAAVSRGAWLKRIEGTNVVTAHLAVVLLLSLMSPLADPRRLSVADQLDRLERGAVSPADFDYAFLRFHAGRRGEVALKGLAEAQGGPQTVEIARRAREALAQTDPHGVPRPLGVERRELVTVVGGGELPPSFLAQSWSPDEDPLRFCARRPSRDGRECDALVGDVTGDGRADVLLFGGGGRSLFAEDENGWSLVGRIQGPWCVDIDAGPPTLAPPNRRWNDVVIGGRRFVVTPEVDCEVKRKSEPKASPAPKPD